jgi:serine/threonine-protein kinase
MPSPDCASDVEKQQGNQVVKPAACGLEELDTLLPRPFGRLMLLKQLARGGMGEVYLAAAGGIEGAERPCVVKSIRREHEMDRSFVARFLDEARIQAQLQHPGVVQVLEAATDEDQKPYVVLEYVEGKNLAELRHRAGQLGTRIPWADAVAIGVALTEALAHVHERTDAAGKPLQIVHRDLSPQNVMAAYAGDVKIIDFGTARGQNRRCQTVAGIVFAKPGYVAPEVANQRPGGAAADLYAAGIMLWELLANRRFLSGTPSDHLAKVAAGERRPAELAELLSAPAALDRIIAKLTAHEIEQRYASAREAMVDLVELLKQAPSLPEGERSVRRRISKLLERLYPAEPARSRAEFARLVAVARASKLTLPKTPEPSAPVVEQPDDVLPGTRYRLLKVLGQGGMGVVHEAEHLDLGRRVALKVLTSHGGNAPAVERFRAEARAIAGLRHENLVSVYDFGVSADGQPYYAMELLEGETLEQLLDRERSVDWREAVRLGIEACRALEIAHDAGLVHRDIKPGNLFLTQSGTLKLLDFGLAKARVEHAKTHNGALIVLGTPEYMPPEQAEGREVDERSDLYALGCVLYELVTGTLPFQENTTVALLDVKRRSRPESPCQRAPTKGIPGMLDRIIERAIERDPEGRYRSAAEMRDALARALTEPLRARSRRRAVGYALLGSVALGVLGMVGYGSVNPEVKDRALAEAQIRLAPLADKLPENWNAASWLGLEPTAPAADPKALAVAEPQPLAPAASPVAAEVEATDEVASDEATDESDAISEDAAALAQEVAHVSGQANSDAQVAEEETAEDGAQPTNAASPAPTDAPDAVGTKVAEARALLADGKKTRALWELRRLGKRYPADARVLAAWADAAAEVKGWGEAYRVTKRWVALEKTPDSQVKLASLQRSLGKKRDALRTLEQVLAETPEHPGAKDLLAVLSSGKAAVAMK